MTQPLITNFRPVYLFACARNQYYLGDGESKTLEAQTLRFEFIEAIVGNRCFEILVVILIDIILEFAPILPVVLYMLEDGIVFVGLVLDIDADDITYFGGREHISRNGNR